MEPASDLLCSERDRLDMPVIRFGIGVELFVTPRFGQSLASDRGHEARSNPRSGDGFAPVDDRDARSLGQQLPGERRPGNPSTDDQYIDVSHLNES